MSGLGFAVGINHCSRILLYNQANIDNAPFLTITLEDPSLSKVTFPLRAIYINSDSLSTNGKYLLVSCSDDAHYIIDAFEVHLLAKFVGHMSLERRRLDVPLSIEPQRGCSGEGVLPL